MNAREKFLINEVWIASWSASVQRASVYHRDALDSAKRKFKKRVKEEYKEKYLDMYKNEVSEQSHIGNIKSLSQYGTKIGKEIGALNADTYRIGNAQKLLNLYLKYLWCMGKIAEPPHCPIDRRIQEIARVEGITLWTNIKSIEEYKGVIKKLKDKATGQSLAQWELENYTRR